MKTVSKTFELQTLQLSQLQLGLPLQGFMCQTTFRDFEGKTSA